MRRRAARLALIPAAVLAAGACFATRNDVRTLQGDLAVMRAENARSDSVHRAEFRTAALHLSAVADSVQVLDAFMARFASDVSRFQGDLSINMHTFGQQLIALQELTGQSQKKLQDVKAELERQQSELLNAAQRSTEPAAAAAASGAPGAPGAPGAGGAPPPSVPQTGPNQLYQTGMQMLTRGSYPAARAAFEGLIDQFPTDDLAGEAQWGIARTYDLEGNAEAADSSYAVVVAKYPKASHASNALYKRGMAAKQAGQAAKARAFFQQILDQYPGSPEAAAVQDLLRKP